MEADEVGKFPPLILFNLNNNNSEEMKKVGKRITTRRKIRRGGIISIIISTNYSIIGSNNISSSSSTRQVLPHTPQSLSSSINVRFCHNMGILSSSNNQLGFDLATMNEHKLACLWRRNIVVSYNGGSYFICHVLTLGHQGFNAWTKMIYYCGRWYDQLITTYADFTCCIIYPKNNLGIIYDGLWIRTTRLLCLETTFDATTFPYFVFDHPLDHYYYQVLPSSYRSGYFQVGGHLATLIRMKNTTTTTSLIDADDWLVYEILTRLPVKSLFRFKTVSKEWCSLIEKDQNFILSHLRTRSLSRLFIVVPVPMIVEDFEDNRAPENEVYITADLMLFEDHNKGRGTTTTTTTTTTREVVVDTVREVDSYSYSVISKPVNGLVCLIDMEDYNSVSICNISTRQLSPWFQSTLLSEEEKYNGIPMLNDCRVNPHYQFGFDPTTNEHKVVCVWELCKGGFVCEVLTIPCHGIDGNSRWRRIEEAPQYKLACDAVYVNGVIYWSTLALANGEWGSNRPSICIVAFDVGIEKFRTITVSNFILDQPRDHFKLGYSHWGYSSYYSYTGGNATLLEVGGHLAMLIRINHSLFKMYTYEDDDDDDDYKEETGRTSIGSKRSSLSSKDKRWSEVSTMTLPFCLGEKNRVTFHSFVGSDDKIILTTCKRIPCGEEVGKKKCVSYYCYNWKKGIWTELEISGIPSSVPHLCTDRFFGTYFETLLPVYNGDALSLPPMVHSCRWL